jgi:integrase
MRAKRRCDEWSEISLEKGEWRIPAARMKMDWPYMVPLSKLALAILYDLEKVAETLAYAGDVMTWHGFRSMASTLLNEQQRWHPDAIERQLAHAPRDEVRATYNYAEHSRVSPRWMSRRSKPDASDR